MADVSTWDPADENNNKPPPDGWPEFMMPSQVNNSARAVMGAVKRMYDQQVSGAIVLPYLKLAGGAGGQTVTGPVTFAGITAAAITSTGTINAASTISTGGAISAAGAVSGGSISTAGALSAGSISAGNTSVGGMNASSYDMVGAALARVSATSTLLYDRANNWCIQLDNGGGSTYANGTHTFNNRGSTANYGFWNAGGLTVQGAIAAAGAISGNTVTANGITSNGNISAAGTYTGGHLSISGNATVPGTVTTNAIQNNGNTNSGSYTGGSMNLGGEVRGATLFSTGDTTVNSVCYVASVVPHTDFTGICGAGARGWHDVVSYNYVTLSDAALKEDIGPLPNTLALVSAIEPQAFRYAGDQARHWGFVAQDVRSAVGGYPVDLTSGEEGRLGLDYGGLTAMLWKAVQELNARLTALETGGL